MKHFKDELKAFLEANGLPQINATRFDGWVHFLHLYASVISDCPLLISAGNNPASGITSVTVKAELANKAVEQHMFFKVTWDILDKNGLYSGIDLYNSFVVNPVVSQMVLVQHGSNLR
jgi:hypothetical protein